MKANTEHFKFSRKTKILLGISISLCAVVLVVLSVFFLYHYMFDWNDRFILRKVVVESPEGWWHKRVGDMIDLINRGQKEPGKKIELKGATNLFKIDPLFIRKQIMKEPGIRSVQVVRQLPDTLQIHVVERFPSAILGSMKSPFLIDQDGIVIPRKHVRIGVSVLPLIYSRVAIPGFGSKFTEILPALELIRLSKTAYPKIRFTYFYFGDPSYLKAVLYFDNNPGDRYVVEMLPEDPVRNMDRIITSIRDIKRRGTLDRRVIDIRFEGQTVLKTK